MTTLDALIKIKELGYPISNIAKAIGKDPSTLQKWTTGKNNNVSVELQASVVAELHRLREEWLKIDI